mgnify:FL=1
MKVLAADDEERGNVTLSVFGWKCKVHSHLPAYRCRLSSRQANETSKSLHLGSQFFPLGFVTITEILTQLFAVLVGLGLVEEWAALH